MAAFETTALNKSKDNSAPIRESSVFFGEEPGRLGSLVDRLAAGVLLALSSPVIAVSALTLMAWSRRSPFIAHLRVGRHGKRLWVWKLRTMWDPWPPASFERGWVERVVAEPTGDRKAPVNPRVSNWFAAFCRRHSIDELPQFWHVLRGDMSIIGPRPLTSSELARYYGQHLHELLSVKPGLTGVWQTQGRSTLDWHKRVMLDLEMVHRRSLRLYITILIRTVGGIISGKGAW